MKFSATTALLGAAAPLVAAFPAGMLDAMMNDPKVIARAAEITAEKRQAGADAATAVFEAIPTFSESQLIDLSAYPYQAPGPNDLRGPCPGLNAFANHGMIPRNGYATINQFINATTTIVGMGPQLAGFLAIYGALIDGDGTAWSIGGTPPPGVGGPLAQTGNGISGSHNKYEADASPTRGDLYDASTGYDNSKPVASQFQALVDSSPNGLVTIDSLTAFRSQRFDEQIARNPYFFNAPFSGVLVQPAAYTFIFRFMANHTAENPTGLLNIDTLKTWFGITGDSGNYQVQVGHERVPDNWYRRSFDAPYELEYFIGDVLNAAALHPKFLDIGGNTGTVNSFTGVDITNLTGGVFNGATLLQGDNLECFALQATANLNGDLVSGLLKPLTSAISPILSSLSCPQLKSINDAQLMSFPGYKKST